MAVSARAGFFLFGIALGQFHSVSVKDTNNGTTGAGVKTHGAWSGPEGANSLSLKTICSFLVVSFSMDYQYEKQPDYAPVLGIAISRAPSLLESVLAGLCSLKFPFVVLVTRCKGLT